MNAREHTAAAGLPFDGQPGTITIVHPTDQIAALDLEGEFDTSQTPELIEHVQRLLNDHKHLIINLTPTTFIDSAVVHALFTADATAKEQGRSFVLQLGTASNVKRVIAITGADKNVTTAPDREQAINFIKQVQLEHMS